ncbi:MAG: hypothetical protein ACKVW3_11790 [Phycisphaerales bacterium]
MKRTTSALLAVTAALLAANLIASLVSTATAQPPGGTRPWCIGVSLGTVPFTTANNVPSYTQGAVRVWSDGSADYMQFDPVPNFQGWRPLP